MSQASSGCWLIRASFSGELVLGKDRPLGPGDEVVDVFPGQNPKPPPKLVVRDSL
ncbi:MAG: hypothetical protein BMS9Abin28_2295 [Anaerolineae bacterium]|nr:MAG: hypothetical protein BMS9Abin28_2295 [Anaerolineae bacterium]